MSASGAGPALVGANLLAVGSGGSRPPAFSTPHRRAGDRARDERPRVAARR